MEEEEIESHLRKTSPTCIASFRRKPVELDPPLEHGFKTGWRLACKCGGEVMKFLGYPLRDLRKDYRGDLFVSPLACECTKCGSITELLDTDEHGYHAEVAKLEGGSGGNAHIRGKGPRTAFICPKCSKPNFQIAVEFVYWDFDLILDEPDLPAQEFFHEIVVHCTCAACGKTSKPTGFGKL